MYDEKRIAEAWRTFVSTDVIDYETVRPMVARSWMRCRAAGVNPWSSDFPMMDEVLLKEKRQKLKHSLEANTPVMRMLMALLRCNVSLMDQENFVFEFFSPLSFYPRTFGTHCREDQVGSGNASCVAYERRPIRFDRFEHYRAVAHGYSGVSAPFLDDEGNFYGAINANSPFGMLPQCALDMCVKGVDVACELFLMGEGMWGHLRTIEPFMPLVELKDCPVLVVDFRGHILGANTRMRPYLPGLDDFGYGEQSLSGYLARRSPLKAVMEEPILEGRTMPVTFQKAGTRATHVLECEYRQSVQLKNGLRFLVLSFRNPASPESDGADTATAEPAGPKQADSPRRPPVSHGGPINDSQEDYIGASDEWMRVDHVVRRVAPINANAVLLGETGTGKEMVARAIHRHSGRNGNFIAVNCGAIPRDLFAAELFGYEPGAFTGAREDGSIGKIEAANHGTLLLDEIGEMPLDMQVGLLRVIQENAVTRLGSNVPRPLDVRFIAATNRDLQGMVDSNLFRADLFYRLNMIEIKLPPLRKREGDISLLADYFNLHASERMGIPYSPLPLEVLESLENYTWPGNVRELRNVVERCLILAGEGAKATASDLPAHIANSRSVKREFKPAAPSSKASPQDSTLSVADAEELQRISLLMTKHGGNISKVAAELGISRTTLYKRLDKYRLHTKVVVEPADKP